MSDYRPIDCATHSDYELWIMQRELLRIRWRDEDGLERMELLRPTDLVTRAGEEFLVGLTDGEERRRIRLDRILSARPKNGAG